MRRHELLRALHRLLRPRSYLEIGVSTGTSLSLSRTRSIAVDPSYKIKAELHCDLQLVRTSSDEFFAREAPLEHFEDPVVDLAFVDGLHLAEYALRDFINIERWTHPASVVVLDDVLPWDSEIASRDRSRGRARGAWAGDVYKVVAALRSLRPELVCLEVDTRPTGTAVAMLPDAGSTVLDEAYDDLVEAFVVPDPQHVPSEVLGRSRAVDAHALLASPVWAALVAARPLPAAEARGAATDAVAAAGWTTAGQFPRADAANAGSSATG